MPQRVFLSDLPTRKKLAENSRVNDGDLLIACKLTGAYFAVKIDWLTVGALRNLLFFICPRWWLNDVRTPFSVFLNWFAVERLSFSIFTFYLITWLTLSLTFFLLSLPHFNCSHVCWYYFSLVFICRSFLAKRVTASFGSFSSPHLYHAQLTLPPPDLNDESHRLPLVYLFIGLSLADV